MFLPANEEKALFCLSRILSKMLMQLLIIRQKLQEKWIFHPVLLGIFWVLHIYNAIPIYFENQILAYCLGAAILGTASLTWLLPKQNKPRNAIYLSLLLTIVLFAPITTWLHQILALAVPTFTFRAALGLIVGLACLFVWLTWRRRLLTATLYLNLLLGLYCIWELGLGLYKQRALPSDGPTATQPVCVDCPDIYLILTDGYTSTQSLKNYFQHDNTPYLDSLRQKGFYVVARAQSNYHVTVRSMSAMLNMDYLPKPAVPDLEIGERVLRITHNRVNQVLAQRGYSFINASIFDIYHGGLLTTGTPNPYAHASFYYSLFTRTLFGAIDTYLIEKRGYSDRRLVPYERMLQSVGRPRSTPQFAYLHLMLPHGPANYDRNGQRVRRLGPAAMLGYREQLLFINQLMLKLINRIEQSNGRPAIILITGDHGSRELTDRKAWTKEIFTTTTAFYFPDRQYQALYDTMSSVNLFRAVLNKALGEQMPYLPDRAVVRRRP